MFNVKKFEIRKVNLAYYCYHKKCNICLGLINYKYNEKFDFDSFNAGYNQETKKNLSNNIKCIISL